MDTCATESYMGGKSFLPRDAYPMTEPSWRLDVYP
jgi:hypothetical protein